MINIVHPPRYRHLYIHQVKIQSTTFKGNVPFKVIIYKQVYLYMGKKRRMCAHYFFLIETNVKLLLDLLT